MGRLISTSIFDNTNFVDHHCHGVVAHETDRLGFENLITESNWQAPQGTTYFHSQLGVQILNRCGPLLDLEPGVSPEQYLARRAELGAETVNARFLRAAEIDRYLIETGYRGDDILQPQEMADVAKATADEVLRLERLAEITIEQVQSGREFIQKFGDELSKAARAIVGVKSIAAYRGGLEFDPSRPSEEEVAAAADAWKARIQASDGEIRLEDSTLIRHGLWSAVDLGLTIQFHIGYGDPDVDLHRCNPLLLTEWLRLTRESGSRVTLLHCYPYHREAGYLAHVFPHVYCDVGLAINYVGARAPEIIAESLELTPFDKALFSSDAFGASELYFLGAELFKLGLATVLDQWCETQAWSYRDAENLVESICGANAVRAYSLSDSPQFVSK